MAKAIHGESAFSQSLPGSLIAEAEAKFNELHRLLEDAQATCGEGQAIPAALNAQYADLISWADLYDAAGLEAKKMIINCLIRRMKVCRGYKPCSQAFLLNGENNFLTLHLKSVMFSVFYSSFLTLFSSTSRASA